MRILYLSNSYSQQRQHEKPANIYPVRMAMEAEWYRKQGHEVYWLSSDYHDYYKNHIRTYWIKQKWDKVIQEPENLPFLTLPRPDRVFTRAKEYTSGNYKYLPGTHILSASGCWHGRCNFCVERGEPYYTRTVEEVVEEIKECKALGFKEVFDDSATFPVAEGSLSVDREKWLERFYRGVRNTVSLGCNMRISNSVDFMLMKQAGFRMLLFGIESASQYTLDRINKGVKYEDIVPCIKRAATAGIEPHIAVMFGYPWESDEDATATLRLVHYLLRKGYAKTAQASFYSVPDGANPAQRRFVKRIYEAAYYPDFWFHQLRDIRNAADLKYLWLKIKKGITKT